MLSNDVEMQNLMLQIQLMESTVHNTNQAKWISNGNTVIPILWTLIGAHMSFVFLSLLVGVVVWGLQSPW